MDYTNALFGGERPNARGFNKRKTGPKWSQHPLYNIWLGMLYRCYQPNHVRYHLYGARGIRACERWHDLPTFVAEIEAEIGPRPEGLTLDRIDGDRDYEPGNVRWATRTQQTHNWRVDARKGKNTRNGAPTTSRFKGVSWQKDRQKWVAQICVGGRQRSLGRFDDELEAARAFDRAAKELRGEFAQINSV